MAEEVDEDGEGRAPTEFASASERARYCEATVQQQRQGRGQSCPPTQYLDLILLLTTLWLLTTHHPHCFATHLRAGHPTSSATEGPERLVKLVDEPRTIQIVAATRWPEEVHRNAEPLRS